MALPTARSNSYNSKKNACFYHYECRLCKVLFRPLDLEEHLLRIHNIHPSNTCVWCLKFGRKKTKSYEFYQHRECCFLIRQSKQRKRAISKIFYRNALANKAAHEIFESRYNINQTIVDKIIDRMLLAHAESLPPINK